MPAQPAQASPQPPRRATVRFMIAHPARWLALGFGSGLSPVAPGTIGTLWSWVAFLVLSPWLTTAQWGWLIALSLPIGVWACAVTARDMGVADPGQIVWDEIVAFWLVLWIVTPAGFWMQLAAFVLFRYFDAAKPGPVGWADRCLEHRPEAWARGLGILWDDLVAAGCTLLTLAVAVALSEGWGA
ncbi:MAG: phosphatidylglycerophosphatase A [Rubrivivax sp.]|nr:phosphatidylglycerophosphatase A [Rubrivivax sp.]